MHKLLVVAPAVAALAMIGCQAKATDPAGSAGSAGSAGAAIAAGSGSVAGAAGSGSAAGTTGSGSAAGATGSGSAAGAAVATGSGSAAADPWGAASAPRPPETPEQRKARAEAAVGRVMSIEPELAKLRALTFLKPVPAHYQTAADFQGFVHREIAKELPPARSRDLTAALAHLGLLDKPVDLAKIEEQAMVTQAGAYYDPATKQFFLVAVPDSEMLLDTISAHELTHALQDQHFDLKKYLPEYNKIDEDVSTARRFVVEGDATFAMLLYMLHGLIPDPTGKKSIATLRIQIEQFARQSIDDLKAQSKSQGAMLGALGGEFQKAFDAMDDIPQAVLVPLLDAYMKGALVVLTAFEHGGWPAVDELYRTPPESTEQVLHPATKLYPERDHPHKVALGKLADPELAGNVLGELQWRIYFALWKVANGDDAAAGWGGDRFSVTRRKDGRLIGRIATVWDTEQDAQQFATAYAASLARRFPGADLGQLEAGVARPDGGKVFMRTTGTRVFIVDGADDTSVLDALARTAKLD